MRRRSAVTAAVTAGALVLVASCAVPAAPAAPAPARGGGLVAFSGWVGDDTEQSLRTVDPGTGQVRTVAPGRPGDVSWSADGRRLVWIGFDGRTDGGSTLYSARPDGSDRRALMSGFDLRAVATGPDGSIAVARSAVQTDADCATRPPVPVAELVLLSPAGVVHSLGHVPVNTADLTFSPDGATLLWRAQAGDSCTGGDYEVFLTDLASGRTRQVAGDARRSGWASFSAGATTVVAARSDELGQDLVRIDVATATSQREVTPAFAEEFPVFSPDGTKLAMVRTPEAPAAPGEGVSFRPTGAPRVVVTDAGGRLLQDLGPAPVRVEHLVWAPDGTFLALDGFTSVPACEGCDYGSADPAVWRFPLDGGAPSLLTTAGGFDSADLVVQPTVPDAPALDRGARRLRP
jgi:Tol biopolymer transport system component